MKKKIIKQLIKIVRNEVRDGVKESRHYYGSTKLKKPKKNSNELFCAFDSEVSEKFYKFVLAIFKFRDILNFEINEERIAISGDLSRVNAKNNINPVCEDYLDIEVSKEGFTFRRTYGAFVSFKDEFIFDKLIITLREKNEIFSKSHLIQSIDDISILTNLVRELNLENLMSSFD